MTSKPALSEVIACPRHSERSSESPYLPLPLLLLFALLWSWPSAVIRSEAARALASSAVEGPAFVVALAGALPLLLPLPFLLSSPKGICLPFARHPSPKTENLLAIPLRQ
jgi:drug/metabolite transporter (DMT)-like permease